MLKNINSIEQPVTLPRRDYILLPLIFIVTCIAMCVIGEIACRVVWPVSLSG